MRAPISENTENTENKFKFEDLLEFMNCLTLSQKIVDIKNEITCTINSSYSTDDKNKLIMKLSLDKLNDDNIAVMLDKSCTNMFRKVLALQKHMRQKISTLTTNNEINTLSIFDTDGEFSFVEIMNFLDQMNSKQQEMYITKAKKLLIDHNVNYINLEDAHSVVHPLYSRDLDGLAKVLEGNNAVTGLSVYSRSPEITNKAIKIVGLHPEISNFHLFLNGNAVYTNGEKNVESTVNSITKQMSHVHDLESYKLDYHAGGSDGYHVFADGEHVPTDLMGME